MWQAEYKLHLYPEDPDYKVDSKVLVSLLKEQKFIDQSLSENRFATGDKFVFLLTFMGCSPNIELEPQEDSPYCYIEIDSSDKQHFIFGKNTKVSKCPHCKETMLSFIKTLKQSKNTNISNCPLCNKAITPQKLNWRKSAFFAKSWITIGNIYEMEAVPNDQLLTALESKTGVSWKPAYTRQDKN